MILLKLALGLLFIVLGWIYFFRPNSVLTINKAAREFLFNDRIILLQRKKVAIMFFCFSFIALYMGFTSLTGQIGAKGQDSWVMEASSYMMYSAMQDYCREKYDTAINKYKTVLAADPENLTALRRLSYTYEACGDTAKARMIWQKILKIEPDNKEIMAKLGMKKNGNKR